MTLADVLAGRKVTYWNSKGIVMLNLLLLLPQVSCCQGAQKSSRY